MRAFAAALLAACLLSTVPHTAPHAAEPLPDLPAPDLLRRVDAYRMPRTDVRVRVDILDLDRASGERLDEHGYRVYLAASSDSVVEMLAPAERGRRVLMTDDAVWLHIPTSARPIRITPLQRLLGQANTGDVGRLVWATSYRIAGSEDAAALTRPALDAAATAVGARFRPLAGHPLRLLHLEAVNATATYPRLDVWISAVDLVPIRADYFLTSGKRQKTGWFTEPQATAQGEMVRAVAYLEHDDAARVTVLHTADVTDDRRPAGFFTVRGFTAEALP